MADSRLASPCRVCYDILTESNKRSFFLIQRNNKRGIGLLPHSGMEVLCTIKTV